LEGRLKNEPEPGERQKSFVEIRPYRSLKERGRKVLQLASKKRYGDEAAFVTAAKAEEESSSMVIKGESSLEELSPCPKG